MSRTLSVVIPVYNNQETLEEAFRQISEVRANHFPHLGLELVFVNDGGKDHSWEVLTRLKQQHPDIITLVKLSRNFGQHGALFAGFNTASGDAVICISADLQDPVSLMADMVKHWESGSEIVVGYRQERKDGALMSLLSRFAYSLARMSSPDLPRGGCDYWLMSRRVNEKLCALKGRHNFIQGQLFSLGFTKTLIPYTRQQRQFGRSGYRFGKRFKIVVDFLVDSSYVPIRFMSGMGMLIALAGVIYSLMIVYAWFTDKTPFPGWAPLMIMLMLIGGSIMIMLGVIGEYIWRIYDNGKDFPLYIIDETDRHMAGKG